MAPSQSLARYWLASQNDGAFNGKGSKALLCVYMPATKPFMGMMEVILGSDTQREEQNHVFKTQIVPTHSDGGDKEPYIELGVFKLITVQSQPSQGITRHVQYHTGSSMNRELISSGKTSIQTKGVEEIRIQKLF